MNNEPSHFRDLFKVHQEDFVDQMKMRFFLLRVSRQKVLFFSLNSPTIITLSPSPLYKYIYDGFPNDPPHHKLLQTPEPI